MRKKFKTLCAIEEGAHFEALEHATLRYRPPIPRTKAAAMPPPRGQPPQRDLHQAALYWKQLCQLKASCVCIRLYRNRLRTRVRFIDCVKAIASSGGVVAWAKWPYLAPYCTTIIALAQLLDALKGVFPFAKDNKAANDLTVALEVIYIDAEDEWEAIFADKVEPADIIKRRTKLRKLQLDAERKHFPDGIQFPQKIIDLADEDADAYFAATFNQEAQA